MGSSVTRRVAFVAIIATLLFTQNADVSAETNIQYLIRTCPNGGSIAALNRRVQEADALKDENRFVLHYDYARAVYQCSQAGGNDDYRNDLAKLFYLQDLEVSARTNGEEVERGTTAAQAANDLAASTRFPYIRKIALTDRARFRAAVKLANDTITRVEPTSGPTPDTFPVPASTPNATGPVRADDDSQAAISQAISHYSHIPECPDADVYVDDANHAIENSSTKGLEHLRKVITSLAWLGDSYTACSLRSAENNSTATPSTQTLKTISSITLAQAFARYGAAAQSAALYDQSPNKASQSIAQDMLVSFAKATLHVTSLITRIDEDQDDLRLAATIEFNIEHLVTRCAINRINEVYKERLK